MPRPFCPRRIAFVPDVVYFKPAGVPMRFLSEVKITLDEFEAIRLADLEGLYQEEAAEKMKISRPTFTRLIESARKKIADAIINGKALRIEGGPVINPQSEQIQNSFPNQCGRRGRRGRAWQKNCDSDKS